MDTAPQLADTDVPYCAWGTNPSFFDAPSTPRGGISWNARTFLVASPDALMSRTVEPICGFQWGYTTHGNAPATLPLTRTDDVAWSSALTVLRERYPSWTFAPVPIEER